MPRWNAKHHAKELAAHARKCVRQDTSTFPQSQSGTSNSAAAPHYPVWEWRFQQLAEFKLAHGHCEVPKFWRENPALAHWVAYHRELRRRGRMNPQRFARLDALGFAWQTGTPQQKDEMWETHCAMLLAFHSEHGHTRVTKQMNPLLAQWQEGQRRQRKSGRLSPDRIAQLDAIGFQWDGLNGHQGEWESMFQQLQEFHRTHGHSHVPAKWSQNPSLARWVAEQRHSNGEMSVERKARLDSLGFVWQPGFQLWSKRWPEIHQQQQHQGNSSTVVPTIAGIRSVVPASAGAPVPQQMQGQGDQDDDDLWEQRHAQMVAFWEQSGHTQVPQSYERNHATWRETQRKLQELGQLDSDRIARLEAIGFEWDGEGPRPPDISRNEQQRQRREQHWERRFLELLAYKERHGHTQVPQGWHEEPGLASWVGEQRNQDRRGVIPAHRRQRLDDIGFVWRPSTGHWDAREGPSPRFAALWDQRYAELIAFKNEHGHTSVTGLRPEHRKLATWRREQQVSRRKGRLHTERIARLDAIGFNWGNPR